MFKEDLKILIEKNYGEIEKMENLRRSEVFNEIHKDLAILMKRDFQIALQIAEIQIKEQK